MSYEITKPDVWVVELEDSPGTLAEKLAAVLEAGANLDFVIARRSTEKPGHSILFLAPLVGARQTQAAERAGMRRADSLHSIRIEGPDRPGLGAGITKTISDAGINMRGLSAAGLGDRALFYVAFENDHDAVKATQLLARMLV